MLLIPSRNKQNFLWWLTSFLVSFLGDSSIIYSSNNFKIIQYWQFYNLTCEGMNKLRETTYNNWTDVAWAQTESPIPLMLLRAKNLDQEKNVSDRTSSLNTHRSWCEQVDHLRVFFSKWEMTASKSDILHNHKSQVSDWGLEHLHMPYRNNIDIIVLVKVKTSSSLSEIVEK